MIAMVDKSLNSLHYGGPETPAMEYSGALLEICHQWGPLVQGHVM